MTNKINFYKYFMQFIKPALSPQNIEGNLVVFTASEHNDTDVDAEIESY